MATEYIIAQTKNNIQFLQSIDRISSEDARQILSKLPGPDRNLEVRQNSPRSPSPAYGIRGVGANSPSVPPRPSASNYRALWSFSGQEAKDLSFNAGEVIQVIDQTNSNWWTGRLNGREGQFPSSYVERIPDTPQPRSPPPMPRQPGNLPNFSTGPPEPNSYPQQPQYFRPPPGPPPPSVNARPPPGPPPGNMYPPPGPPPGNMYSPNPVPSQGPPSYVVAYSGPPPQGPPQGPMVVASAQQAPNNQGSGGSLKNTLAHSAVGGVGLGAGSAIGRGIIDSLF